MTSLANPKDVVRAAAKCLHPPPNVSGSLWAEQYRILSSEDSGAPGRWDLSARKFQNEIMDCACDLTHEFTTVMGPSQWGKTAVGLNIIGHTIHINPGPMMVVHPTISSAAKWSKTRFSMMTRDCPELAALISPEKSREASNTILEKVFTGGILINVGANAPAGLASQPIRYLIFEELDRVPLDATAGEEGDYEALAIARTTDQNYRHCRKIYRSSSPTILGQSRIERALKTSDQRHWHFCCPHCGHEQRPRWESVQFTPDAPDDAFYQCDQGCHIEEHELRRPMREGRWIATRPEVKGHAGFFVHGLQVRDMAYIVKEFLEARKGGAIQIQTWRNTCLGELFNTREGEEAKQEGLLKRSRAEKYSSGTVPSGCCLIHCGIDVQTSNPQRLEVVVMGTGVGHEQWVIQHQIISGNLATNGPWDKLEEFLLTEWERQDGKTMRIRAAAIDTGGHFRGESLKFFKRPRMRGIVWPIKGASKFQRNIAVRAKTKYQLHLLDGTQLKDILYGNLSLETPGPRYIHFPNDLDQEFFTQLLGERPINVNGRRGYAPYPRDQRVEILDCVCYSNAALEISGPWNMEDLAAFYSKSTHKRSLPTAKDAKGTLRNAAKETTIAEPGSAETPAAIESTAEPVELPLSPREKYRLKMIAGKNLFESR